MASTVADLLVERLIDWKVDTVFALPGDGINGLYESLRTHKDAIRLVQVQHEEPAALAACGYAKFTGRVGVCLATSGPGGIHLLNGLYDAKFDGQPVLAITGHTFHDLIGTHYQQDIDLDRVFSDVAAYSERVMGPAHVCNAVDQAIRTALSTHAVAHITIPKDIQDWPADGVRSKANIVGHSGHQFSDALPLPGKMQLEAAAAILNQGSKIAILAGRGCLLAREEIVMMAEQLGAVIVKPLLGKAVVPDDHPCTTGGIGLLGTAPSQEVLESCDTLLIAGSSFPYLEFYPTPGAVKAIQIDVDPSRIGLRHPVDIGLVGQCQNVLQALMPLITPTSNHDFLKWAQERKADWDTLLEKRANRDDIPMKPQVIAHALNAVLTDDAIICCDTGTVTTWAARHIRIRGTMQFSVSGTLATMGNGLPYSIGASMVYPGRQVVCFAGDGGFTMLMGELATAVKYQLPIKIIVVKNNTFGMIKWEQIAFEGNPQYGVDLQAIDFAAFARACGASGYSLSDPAKVKATLNEAFEQPGPVLIEVDVDPYEPPLPGKVTTDQAWRFTKAMIRGQKDRLEILKTVIVNRTREVV